jgi:hypothetical protein
MQNRATIASFAGHLLGSGVFADPKLFTMHLLLGCLIALSKVRQQYRIRKGAIGWTAYVL